jgi:hypothetical protein
MYSFVVSRPLQTRNYPLIAVDPRQRHILLLFFLTANGVLPGGSGTTIRYNTQVTHITQNNTPRSNKTQHTKLHKQLRTHYTQLIQRKYNYNYNYIN